MIRKGKVFIHCFSSMTYEVKRLHRKEMTKRLHWKELAKRLHWKELASSSFMFVTPKGERDDSAAGVKMEIPVLVRSLKSSILSSTSLQRDKTFWGVASAAVEQSRRKANMVNPDLISPNQEKGRERRMLGFFLSSSICGLRFQARTDCVIN